jgi:hypothetical protein
MSAWPSVLRRALSCFTAHEFDGSRVQTPGVYTVNQAVHPSRVGKFVAISMQWVTAVEDCEVLIWLLNSPSHNRSLGPTLGVDAV